MDSGVISRASGLLADGSESSDQEGNVMSTRTITYATVALLLALTSARAQFDKLKDTTPDERATAQTELMKSTRDLTGEQTSKVAELNLTYAKRMEPIIKGAEDSFMKMRHAEEINSEKEAALKSILSPEQFTKFLSAEGGLREKFENQMEHRAGEGE